MDVTNDGTYNQTFGFDADNDGSARAPTSKTSRETNVPQSVYQAAQVGLIVDNGGNCWRIVDSLPTGVDPIVRLTKTGIVETVEPWRLKQKGQIVNGQIPSLRPTPSRSRVVSMVSAGCSWPVPSSTSGPLPTTRAISSLTHYTQWVLTFPTKHYYVDLQDDVNLLDDISPTLAASPLPVTPPEAFSPFWQSFATGGGLATGNQAGQSCEPIKVDMWNREEEYSQFTSPAPTPENSLCWETNVLTFNQSYADAGLDSDFTTVIDERWLPTNFDGTVAERGWARVTFTGFGAVNTGLLGPRGFTGYGLPVTGFMFSVYETGDAATAHAAINSHKYERDFQQ